MNTTYIPYFPIHPGEFLKDELEARSMTQKELAKRLNYSYSVITKSLTGNGLFQPNSL